MKVCAATKLAEAATVKRVRKAFFMAATSWTGAVRGRRRSGEQRAWEETETTTTRPYNCGLSRTVTASAVTSRFGSFENRPPRSATHDRIRSPPSLTSPSTVRPFLRPIAHARAGRLHCLPDTLTA